MLLSLFNEDSSIPHPGTQARHVVQEDRPRHPHGISAVNVQRAVVDEETILPSKHSEPGIRSKYSLNGVVALEHRYT